MIPTPQIYITNGRTRSPEEWAHLFSHKVVHVSNDAPQPIRDQAHAFQTAIERVFANYLRMALDEERAALIALGEKSGGHLHVEQIRGRFR